MKNKVKGGRLAELASDVRDSRRDRHKTQGPALAAVLTALLLAAVGTAAHAEGASDEEPLELRKIMRELGKNMQATTDAISREDWARVAAIAPSIAEHPQPPTGEKVRILAFVGSNVPRFRAFDGQTHKAAHRMAEAASRKDGAGVIAAFADVQTGCLGCHQAFRKNFVEHFYGAP
jgi:cytochrome c556